MKIIMWILIGVLLVFVKDGIVAIYTPNIGYALKAYEAATNGGTIIMNAYICVDPSITQPIRLHTKERGGDVPVVVINNTFNPNCLDLNPHEKAPETRDENGA